MEDHKVSQSTRVLACNRYTVFLCRADYQRLGPREREILAGLERHLQKHVRDKNYETGGDIVVAMTMDPELEPGYFGILAERIVPLLAKPRERVTSAMKPASSPAVAAPKATTRSGMPSRPRAARAAAAGGTTRVVRPEEAADLDLARQTIVLKAGNRVREFSRGRIILGRGRDVDFRVDDPNVSRRHAAVYWADGDIMVEDLDSTNGTLVNGYPVTSTVLRPGDVLAIGDCRITVETK
jgi:hypothetical protein